MLSFFDFWFQVLFPFVFWASLPQSDGSSNFLFSRLLVPSVVAPATSTPALAPREMGSLCNDPAHAGLPPNYSGKFYYSFSTWLGTQFTYYVGGSFQADGDFRLDFSQQRLDKIRDLVLAKFSPLPPAAPVVHTIPMLQGWDELYYFARSFPAGDHIVTVGDDFLVSDLVWNGKGLHYSTNSGPDWYTSSDVKHKATLKPVKITFQRLAGSVVTMVHAGTPAPV